MVTRLRADLPLAVNFHGHQLDVSGNDSLSLMISPVRASTSAKDIGTVETHQRKARGQDKASSRNHRWNEDTPWMANGKASSSSAHVSSVSSSNNSSNATATLRQKSVSDPNLMDTSLSGRRSVRRDRNTVPSTRRPRGTKVSSPSGSPLGASQRSLRSQTRQRCVAERASVSVPFQRKATSDNIPKPGIRKVSSHGSVLSANAQGRSSCRINSRYDSTPKPGMRQGSNHSTSSLLARAVSHDSYYYDTIPKPGMRKESAHGSVRHACESHRLGAPRRPNRRVSVQRMEEAPDDPGYFSRQRQSDPQLMSLASRTNHHHNYHSTTTTPKANYHSPRMAPYQPQRRESAATSISAISCVSDLTDGKSLGDDSLPIWGDHIDHDEQLHPSPVAPPPTTSLHRQSTWSHPTTTTSTTTTRHPAYTTPNSHRQPPNNNNNNKKPQLTVELQPGFSLPLRGKDETLYALECHFVAQPTCLVCSLHMTCIADAEYVLCPVCKSISPIDGNAGNGGGVGLGMRMNITKTAIAYSKGADARLSSKQRSLEYSLD